MLQILTLPTDSLYKFLFVFGIVLIISSQIIGNQEIKEYGKAITLNNQAITSEVNKMDKLKEQVENEHLSIRKRDSLRLEYNSAVSTANKNLKMLEKQADMNSFQADMDSDSLDFALITGYFLSILGAILWYFKIQRTQDKILKLQLKELETNIANLQQ